MKYYRKIIINNPENQSQMQEAGGKKSEVWGQKSEIKTLQPYSLIALRPLFALLLFKSIQVGGQGDIIRI